jgi:hypothetical protein
VLADTHQSRERLGGRQNFHNLAWLVLVRVAPVNQRVVEHHNLDNVSAAWTPNTDAPAVGEFCDLLVVEPEFINAMGTGEQRNALCHGKAL